MRVGGGTQLALPIAMLTAYSHDEALAPIPLRGEPNGLAWDRDAESLYVALAITGTIVRVAKERQTCIATIDSGGVIGTHRIGGLAITPWGTLFATRLGYGRAGAVFRVDPDGSHEPIPELSPAKWRLGLAFDAHDNLLYTTEYSKSKHGPFGGAIVEIDLLDGFCSTVVEGFAKPVGVVKLGSSLVVTDARQRAVFRVELRAGRAVSCVQLAGDIDRPDSICACGPDSVLVTCFDEVGRRGCVRRLWLDGRTRVIASGDWEPRGVATDGDRVFVAARRGGRVLVFPFER